MIDQLMAIWNSVKHCFNEAYELVDGAAEYWDKHGVIGTLEDFANEMNDYVDEKIDGTSVGTAKTFWEKEGLAGGLKELGNEVSDLWKDIMGD